MSYDVRAAAQAARNLAPKSKGGKGQVVTVVIPSVGTVFDPISRKNIAGSPARHEGSGIELFYETREIDGKAILTGDTKLMLSPKKTNGEDMPVFDEKALIELSAGERQVVKVGRFAPAGLTVYFEVQLRGKK